MKHRQECLQNREMFLNHKLGNNNQDMKDETRHDSKRKCRKSLQKRVVER